MEVRRGYKQSEAGVIPEGWDVQCLSSLLTAGPKNGYSGRSANDAPGTPTLGLGATTSGALILNDETVKRLEETIDATSDLFLQSGDVLVQRSNTIDLVGTTAVFNGPSGVYVYPDLMMRLRFREQVTAHWFWRYANGANGRRFFMRVAAGSSGSMPKISGEKLRGMQLPVPPLPERRAIATALSDVDALLSGLDRLIAKKHDLKQAAMQQLLTGQTRLPGFSGQWEMKQLDEIGRCFAGGTPSTTRPDYWGGDVFWLPSGRVQNNILGAPSDSEITITERGLSESVAKRITPCSVLVAITGATCANVSLLQFEAAANQSVVAIEPFDETDARYIFYALLMERGQILSRQSGSAQGGVNLKAVKRIVIRCPLLNEQVAIAAVLSDMDAELAALEARRDKTSALKQAMMQELLTGKTRLVPAGASRA